jgi:hypothetical protein
LADLGGGARRFSPSDLRFVKLYPAFSGVSLATIGADEAQIQASFGEAIRIAKEQKAISLQKRAEETYAEYRRQKASASPGCRFRLPFW